MASNVNQITVSLNAAEWVGDDVTAHMMKAPADVNGGGITILEAWVTNAAATGAGTAFSIQLENWGTAGTGIKASGGTIATIGGTGDVFAADTPKEGTVSNTFIDGDEWVVIRKNETNSSDPSFGMVTVVYELGR